MAIVGESGSGKSVTTKAILGIIDDNGRERSGEILYRRQIPGREDEILNLLTLSEDRFQKQIRGRQIAIIFQDPMTSLNPTMTIGKQIIEGMLEFKKSPTNMLQKSEP